MKNFTNVIAVFFTVCVLSSCATVFGGRVNTYQKTKPLPGQAQRPMRVVAFICDVVFFWPGAIVDFATGAIYRPHPPTEVAQPPVVAAQPEATTSN